MKNYWVLSFLALAFYNVVHLCASQSTPNVDEPKDIWLSDGKQLSTSFSKANKGFGAQLHLINDESFFKNWEKPNPPAIKDIDKIQRGQKMWAIILFSGLGYDEKGAYDLTYDFYLIDPVGKERLLFKDVIGAKGEKGTPDNKIHLGASPLYLTFDQENVLGTYSIRVVVRDNVKKLNLDLLRKIDLEGKQ